MWPSVAWEDVPWTSTIPPELLSQSAAAKMRQPYRASIPAAIADIDVTLPRHVNELCETAANLVRDFDIEVGHEIAPFGAILLRTESASSSQIENLTSGAKQIAFAQIGEEARANAALIVDNVRAMNAALALSDNLDGAAILEMHTALLGRSAPEIAGAWRQEQVWIGGGAYSPHNATFVPPRAEHVPDAIVDLARFADRHDISAITLAAIAHAQFETIHPFVDGNGRVGRALIHVLLHRRGLTRSVTVPVSAGLLVDTESYFEALTAYREGDAAPIVAALAEAAIVSIHNGRELVADLHAAKENWMGRVRARSDSTAWPLIDLILRQPVISSATVVAELGITHSNAMRAIERLVEAQVLEEVGGRRRSILWQAPVVLSALDAFAARAGRRRLPKGNHS